MKTYLDSRKDDLTNLFITERMPYRQLSNHAIQDEIANITSRTKISKNISPRTFRETFSRVMSDKGYQSYIIDSLLGYSSKSIRSESYFVLTNNNIWDIVRPRPEF